MTTIARVAKATVVAFGLMITATPAFATNAGLSASAASFVPYGPSDVNYIQHSTTQVYNTDANASHYVIANLGVASFSGQHTWTLQGSAFGASSIQCWLTAIRLDGNGGTVLQENFTYNVNGPFLNLWGLTFSPAARYAVTFTCLLPPSSTGVSINSIYD
jgi:hypothetical protein